MDKAAFILDSYQFTKAILDFEIPENSTLDIKMVPSGKLYQTLGKYELSFQVIVFCIENDSEVVNIECRATFGFNSSIKIENIPDFFYPNSLAIIFPYVRAFVSTLTLQANIRPVILPTVNLVGLTNKLKDNTIIAD